MASKYTNTDEYIDTFPESTQKVLREIRAFIKTLAPDATEKISYGIPTFVLNGYLIYFAGYKHHVSLYPAPRGIKGFEELDNYKGGKGTVQFPLNKPLPWNLIKRVVNYRIKEKLYGKSSTI